MNIRKYKTVSGRGLNTKTAITLRKEHLSELGYSIEEIEKTKINQTDIQKNIESFIGSVEIPSGLVGPLLYCNSEKVEEEEVFCVATTLEGALVASMNRGAKAISMSGGFEAKFIHQKMVRSPLFILSNIGNAIHFEKWVKSRFDEIKMTAEGYSNHANLLELNIYRDNNNVHVNFVYTTGDAAGQNMTTSCTWHAVLWIVEQYASEGNETISDFVLEGNGSSDKKVSQFLIDHGRGSKVKAHAILDEKVINKVLRTSSEKLLKFYTPSRTYAKKNGMIGYTINAANAIAAIYAATGQDLGSIPESSVAELELKKHPKGLEVTLTLFSLVIGTLGGGTHLTKQQEALELLGCAGENKIQRFASLIAGFTMGLELSTYAAMVSGEFAKAHEKLGRNKPVNWLNWHEVDQNFIISIVSKHVQNEIKEVSILRDEIDNGILMNLCKKVNRKLIGFIPADVKTENKTIKLLLKSKATDLETIKGIHMMAASIDPELSDFITAHQNYLEYKGSHLKELLIPEFISSNKLNIIPKYYNHFIDESREIYILAQERLSKDDITLIDSENDPELWDEKHVKNCIDAITSFHLTYLNSEINNKPKNILVFDASKSITLYKKLVQIAESEEECDSNKHKVLYTYLEGIDNKSDVPKTLIHNDYNPRNIAIRNNDEVCIYDWELAVINYPHRDIVELLSFTLPSDFNEDLLMNYLRYHYEIAGVKMKVDWETWRKTYISTLKEYVLTRVLFYNAAQVVLKLKFVDRIYNNCIKMLKFLEK